MQGTSSTTPNVLSFLTPLDQLKLQPVSKKVKKEVEKHFQLPPEDPRDKIHRELYMLPRDVRRRGNPEEIIEEAERLFDDKKKP